MFELGVMTFGEVGEGDSGATLVSPQQRTRDTVELAAVADQVGLDVFGIGEHHRGDFIASAPAVLLAAAAERTRDIRLTSAVTVLSSEDPVRVWEQFATVDLLSGGRAEIIAGRGSYRESFALFGQDLEDYADLFREKLDLLLRIRDTNPVNWQGRFRSALHEADIAPRAAGATIPIWVGVGGSLGSAVSAGRRGLPMALGILLGSLDQHAEAASLHREAGRAEGHFELPVSVNTHGHVARTSQAAREQMFPAFSRGLRENNHQRGRGFPLPRSAFDAQVSPRSSLIVGSPQQVIDKLMAYYETYAVTRVMVHTGFGGLRQKEHLEAIELLGTEVAPVVRREIASRNGVAA